MILTIEIDMDTMGTDPNPQIYFILTSLAKQIRAAPPLNRPGVWHGLYDSNDVCVGQVNVWGDKKHASIQTISSEIGT